MNPILMNAVRASGGAAFVGAYDGIPNIAAAFGMRRLLSSYIGYLLDMRRSSDNAVQSFGFLPNGDLDTAAVAAFLGGGSGFVTRWYDQSGNGYHTTQATPADQPLYVASGQNGRPVLRFDGSNDNLQFSGSGLGVFRNVPNAIALAVAKSTITSIRQDVINSAAILGSVRYAIILNRLAAGDGGVGGRRLNDDGFQHATASNFFTANTALVATGMLNYADATAAIYKNGTLAAQSPFQTAGNSSDTDSLGARIGAAPNNAHYFSGDIPELILANGAWSVANRQVAESAANGYWGVY